MGRKLIDQRGLIEAGWRTLFWLWKWRVKWNKLTGSCSDSFHLGQLVGAATLLCETICAACDRFPDDGSAWRVAVRDEWERWFWGPCTNLNGFRLALWGSGSLFGCVREICSEGEFSRGARKQGEMGMTRPSWGGKEKLDYFATIGRRELELELQHKQTNHLSE